MPEVFTSGRVLGNRYRLDHMLARGGMATVWVAEDPLLSRQVAVKLLHPELAIDEGLRTRFRNEAVAAARLTHPGIVATYDTGDDDGIAYIVMELVDGSNLRHLLDRHGRLPINQSIDIASQVADALEHAHRQGLVHRDVKPANVLVQPDGRVKVTDFGIAKATGADDLTRTGTVIGTARYLAPEQVNGQHVDGRADVYALGLVLYEMFTGRPPFGGDSDVATAVARLTNAPEPVRVIRAEVPRLVEDVVARSLARDPEYRYSSAREMRDALTGAMRGVPSAARPSARTPARSAPPPRPPGPPRRIEPIREPTPPVRSIPAPFVRPRPRRWPGAVLVVLLVAAAIAGYLAATRDERGGSGSSSIDAQPISIVSATDFDPEGNNGAENPDEVGFAFDDSSGTAWSTETYKEPTTRFGNSKSGVGIYFDLGASHEITEVTVDADADNWDAEIYVGDSAADDLADWGPERAAGTVGTHSRVILDPPARGRYVLLWLTRLPASGRLGITEVTVAGR